jgi:hypothetical protein
LKGVRKLIKKVKKIIALKETLEKDEGLSEKEKVKIQKRITKLRKRFTHISYDEKLQMEIYFCLWGKHIVVDYNRRKVLVIKGNSPTTLPTNIISFLLAYLILLLIFIVASILGAFDILDENLVLSIAVVMNGTAIILNAMNLLDCRKNWKQLKFLFYLLPFVIMLNMFNLIIDLSKLLE